MSKRFNKDVEINHAKVRQGRAILAFQNAMYNADLAYLHRHASEFHPFTLRMEEAWHQYISATVDLYDLTHVNV